MKKKECDVIVVGSGPGGASVALGLARQGKKVLILEAGSAIAANHLGNFWRTVFLPGYYKNMAAFALSLQGNTIYHSKNAGGTSVFSCGNFIRSLEEEFKIIGIDLSESFTEAEREINVAPLVSMKIIAGSKRIMSAARMLDYAMEAMPKGGSYEKACRMCGNCVLGCAYGAKWDARAYLNEATKLGAELWTNAEVKKVILSGGKSIGVETAQGPKFCNQVVLAAGGLNTPVILQKSGIDAGRGLFVDYFNVSYGLLDGAVSWARGASMSVVDMEYHKKGFVLSSYIDHWSQMFLWRPGWYMSHKFPQSRMLGIMNKISDERSGRVFRNGSVSKAPTERDRDKLEAGNREAARILKKAKAQDITVVRHPRGAHPGGTAAVGEVVGIDLQVKGCKDLYVCDASVLPISPGLPPILTIVALGKWLSKRL